MEYVTDQEKLAFLIDAAEQAVNLIRQGDIDEIKAVAEYLERAIKFGRSK